MIAKENKKNYYLSIVSINSRNRISSCNRFNFRHTNHFNQKMSVGKTETGNFIVLLVIRMFTIQISKIVNQTQTFNHGNSPKTYIIEIHTILKIYPIVVRVIQIFMTGKPAT